MSTKRISLVIAPFFFILSLQLSAQKMLLPRSTPEKEGVSSAGIIDFIDAVGKSKSELHGFMFLRHGKVIAEGWWDPYNSALKHTLYSTSKSFTATAVGFAVAEKRLSLDDKAISFFPGELPDTVSSNLAALTVRDVLIMSDGQDPEPTGRIVRDTNWERAFLATPIINKPGIKFLYNSAGTYMLSCIVQKATGQKVIDYLRPRLFEPLGIAGMDWEISPQGVNTGGWGLRLKTEDMAKFGQLFLQKGVWEGKQIIPREWVEEASTMKIMQDPNAPPSKKDSSDWLQGYCYQMWRCRHNGFRADGAFGQFIIVLPDEDAVIAITAETPNMQEEINLVWGHLLPAMHKGTLPVDKNLAARLHEKLAFLKLPPPAGIANPASLAALNGKTFTLQPNEKKMQKLSFEIQGDILQIIVKEDTSFHKLKFGESRWQPYYTLRSGPSLLTGAKAHDAGLPSFKIYGSYDWKDDHTLELILRYIESPHTETMVCHLDGNNISIDVQNSFDYGRKKITLTGSAGAGQ